MIEFNDQLSTDGMHVPRGSKNQVSGDSRIRKARLNARPRGPQSRFIVRPADQSVFQDDWDLDDNFGDYGLSLTTSEMADVESLGRVTFWHPTGAQWCDDPTTFYILPRNAEERAYLRELYYASGAKRTTRSQRTRKGRLRRVNGAPVVPVVPVVAERTRPEREQWTANRPGYVSKRKRRQQNAAARNAAVVAVAA